MGRHAEWRKEMKKHRRKRIRQKNAEELKAFIQKEKERRENSPAYTRWLAKQEDAKLFQEEEELRLNAEKEKMWREKEEEMQRQWQELQKKLAHIKEERRKQEERIQREWEEEQRIIKETKDKRENDRIEQERQKELFRKQIDDYVSNGGLLPEELSFPMETNPGKPVCPFFSKTGVCRFSDACSRNHIRPRVSTILLFPAFYNHFSLEQSGESEYGSDLMLEYEESETYSHFCDFFNDVLPELQKCGCVQYFKVCCNKEHHLRGNVYVEYENTRDAIRAYRSFQGRWYGGKQLNVEFCTIPSWKAAICGLSFRKRCPKGSLCNFLHVFKNPGRMFEDVRCTPVYHKEEKYADQNESRNWRWSVSPERDIEKKESRHRKRKSTCEEYKTRERSKERKKHSKHYSRSSFRSRSNSTSYHRDDKITKLKNS